MCGQEDRPPLVGEAADGRPEAPPGLDVESGRRLVEDEEVGAAGEGEGEEDALALAARELAERAVGEAGETGEVDQLGGRERRRVVGAGGARGARAP